ncbi:MAG: molybdenum cofactor guanylyltransferase [Chthoniobacterales bacterium]
MNITAVLLAGGESRRMGVDKATLLFRGKPLWQVQLDSLQKLHPCEILLSARNDPEWRPNDLHFVADTPPSRGPLSGLTAALGHVRTTHLVAVAIDMPFMTTDYLRSLCDLIAPGCGVLPMINDRAEPLAAIYPNEAHVDLAGALLDGDLSLQPVTARLVAAGKLRAIAVAESDKRLFANLNEPTDLD